MCKISLKLQEKLMNYFRMNKKILSLICLTVIMSACSTEDISSTIEQAQDKYKQAKDFGENTVNTIKETQEKALRAKEDFEKKLEEVEAAAKKAQEASAAISDALEAINKISETQKSETEEATIPETLDPKESL